MKLKLLGLTMLLYGAINAQSTISLRQQILHITDSIKGTVGVGVLGLDFKDSLLINAGHKFPMQSVFKFPLAIAILHKVDQGQLSLTQNIHISKYEIDTNTWSPIARKYGRKDMDISLSELITYTVSQSDNNGCDVLFRLAGGPDSVNRYIHSLGVQGIAIRATEAGMKKAWKVQYTNWCQPGAMLQLLQILYKGSALSKQSNDFLMQIMTNSINTTRLRGQLPENAAVAHKTGTSNTRKGITAATNDVGIITLPDGRHVAVVVYVSDYRGGVPRAEHTIARISRIVWDHYTK